MIDSNPFRSMSIGPPILEMRLFQKFILRFQDSSNAHLSVGWNYLSVYR